MNIEQLKNYQHDKAVIKSWLDTHLPADKAGKGWLCPFCGNGSGKGEGEGLVIHQDKNDPNVHLIHCFSTCSRSWDLIGFIARFNGLTTKGKDFIEACKITAQQIGVSLEAENIELDWEDEIGDGWTPNASKTTPKAQKQANLKDKGKTQQTIQENVKIEAFPNINVYTHEGKNKASQNVNVYNSKGQKRKEITPEQQREYSQRINKSLQALNNSKALAYLNQRGISTETAQKAGVVGYCESLYFQSAKKELPAVLFKKGDYCYSGRSLEDKFHQKSSGQDEPFNFDAYKDNKNDKPIFIVEGNMDALSVLEAGEQAIALDGVAEEHLIRRLKENPINNPFIVMLDSDKKGRERTPAVYKALQEIGANVFNTTVLTESGYDVEEVKDANDYLTKHEEEFRRVIKHASEHYREYDEVCKEYFKNFNKNKAKRFLNGIADSVNNPPIPTGFKQLDKHLDGGLYEGLYIIGGISSLGKTAITLQIADQIAAGGHDVIFFSLEMSENELMARSISRNTAIYGRQNGIDSKNYKTVRGITNRLKYENYSKQEKELITEAMNGYFKDTGENLIILEAQGGVTAEDVRKVVEAHIKYTGNNPVVFIDYLQIMTQPEEVKRSMTEKQVVDENVKKLKHICRDKKIPVFAISSFNRNNYYNPVSLESFKESGGIEYSSDVLIGIERQGQGEFRQQEGQKKIDYLPMVKKYEKKNKERFIHLKILKNRNGASDVSVNFNYQFLFNDFIEGKVAPYIDEDFRLDPIRLISLIRNKKQVKPEKPKVIEIC